MNELYRVYSYEGEGLEKSYVNPAWLVGIKNYKPASDLKYMDTLERHLLTDELFAPFTEGSCLVTMDAAGKLAVTAMEVGKIYCVNQGSWHNVVMQEGGKIILIERPDTGMENSEFCPLSEEEKTELAQLVRQM